jgi:hypothetical protein
MTSVERILNSVAAPSSSSVASSAAAAKPFVLFATHYPLLHYSGKPYERAARWHSVTNGTEMLHAIERARTRPNLIVHGHEHRGFQINATFADGSFTPIYDPGASGNTFSEGTRKPGQFGSKRYAAFHVYSVAASAKSPSSHDLTVQRYVHNGSEFVLQNVPFKEKHGTSPISYP